MGKVQTGGKDNGQHMQTKDGQLPLTRRKAEWTAVPAAFSARQE